MQSGHNSLYSYGHLDHVRVKELEETVAVLGEGACPKRSNSLESLSVTQFCTLQAIRYSFLCWDHHRTTGQSKQKGTSGGLLLKAGSAMASALLLTALS